MEKKSVLVPAVAIILIATVEAIALVKGIDGQSVYYAMTAIAGIAGFNIYKANKAT